MTDAAQDPARGSTQESNTDRATEPAAPTRTAPLRKKRALRKAAALREQSEADDAETGTVAKARPARASARTADTVVIEVRPMATPARMQSRHYGLLLSFVLLVLAPLALSFWYMQTRAADQYASTMAFTVRSDELTSANDLLGGMGAALGGTGGGKDSDILYEFIRSQEMVAAVDARLDLHGLYSRHSAVDPVFGLAPDGAIEDLSAFWRRMVRISYDSASGLMELTVLAFDPAEARAIAEVIQEESLEMINNLSAVARADAMRYASGDLDLALERLKTAREAITAFRLENRIVDVNADIQAQMGVLNTLQSQLASALIDYDLLRNTVREGDPRLEQAQTRIDVIQSRIAEERAKFGGGQDGANYATTIAEYERLTVEREFAETAYLAALQAYDAARAEADRRNRYLATYIRPTLAQKAEFPQRALIVSLTGLFAFLVWAIVCLVFYALRDRR